MHKHLKDVSTKMFDVFTQHVDSLFKIYRKGVDACSLKKIFTKYMYILTFLYQTKTFRRRILFHIINVSNCFDSKKPTGGDTFFENNSYSRKCWFNICRLSLVTLLYFLNYVTVI